MKRVLAALALTGLLAGCGTGSSSSAPDPAVRGKLLGDVGSVREAAQRGDRADAESALATLTRNVAAAQSQGRLDGQTARSILSAADRVAEDVRTFRPPPPVVVTVPRPPDNNDGHQDGGQDGEDGHSSNDGKPGKNHGKPGRNGDDG